MDMGDWRLMCGDPDDCHHVMLGIADSSVSFGIPLYYAKGITYLRLELMTWAGLLSRCFIITSVGVGNVKCVLDHICISC